MLLDGLLGNALLAIVERGGLGGERKAVTFFERAISSLLSWPVSLISSRSVSSTEIPSERNSMSDRANRFLGSRLTHIEKRARACQHFGETGESVACRRATQRVRGDVQALEVFPARLNFLKHA